MAGTGTGLVFSSSSGISCPGTCSASVPGEKTALTAAADTGSVFAGWSGGGCSGTAPCEVSMTEAKTVTATFNSDGSNPPPATHPLNVTTAGTGTGTVTAPGTALNCPASAPRLPPDTRS